jgi:hypothetical protein
MNGRVYAPPLLPRSKCIRARQDPRTRRRRVTNYGRNVMGSSPYLRVQGVNSIVEMSYAMLKGGFDTFYMHMSDLQAGCARLDLFQAFVACESQALDEAPVAPRRKGCPAPTIYRRSVP